MATLLEYERTETQAQPQTREAQIHNAGIKERYRRLRDAEERQFNESNATENTIRASVLAPESPVFISPVEENVAAVEQMPTVTEYVRAYVESPVFTTEKFSGITAEAPVAAYSPVEIPAQAPVAAAAAVAVSQEAQYSLSRMAKIVMAAFAALVVVMLSVICINTQIINQKTLQLRALEEQRAELLEENEAIQSRIAQARSEETIREYAKSQGMIER